MTRWKLREAIAMEAARLMLRGKESGYAAARKRAARWLSRRRLGPDDLPSNAEIEAQIHALSGLLSEEQQTAMLAAMREAALEVMRDLESFAPRLRGAAVEGPVPAGAEVVVAVRGSVEEVAGALERAGRRARAVAGEEAAAGATALRLAHRFPFVIYIERSAGATDEPEMDRAALERRVREAARHHEAPDAAAVPVESGEDYHPDVFPLLRMMLERLETVRLDPERHPEGDALYHSLQVFQRGVQERPYDEEFLLACLLHDVGLGLDRRDPDRAAVEALQGVLTARTLDLIGRRREAREALKSGRVPRSLRNEGEGEDLLLLARLDLQGRVAGAEVPSLDEALDYIAGLGSAWDNA